MAQDKAGKTDKQVPEAFIESFLRRYEQRLTNDLLFVAFQTSPKKFKKKNIARFVSFLLIASMSLGVLTSVPKTQAVSVRIQMCIMVDGSGSINETKWTIIKNGIAEAINGTIPKDGSVELTVVQFGYSPSKGYAKTELAPTVVDGGNCAAIADTILAMPKSNQCTPMAHGIFLGWNELKNSPNFAFSEEQVINLVTDGAANIRNNCTTDDLDSSGGDSPNARDDVIAAVNYAVSQGLDELDVEGIDLSNSNRYWLKNWVVRPQPAHVALPFNPGWIRLVTDSSELAETFGAKFNAALADTNPPNVADVYQLPPTDHVNSTDTVKVFAHVTDDLSGVRQVVMKYTVDGSTPYSVVMSNPKGSNYNATIPAFAHGTHVTYVLVAEDFANNSITTRSVGYNYNDGVTWEIPKSLLLYVFIIATLLSVTVYVRARKPRPTRALTTIQLWWRRRLTLHKHDHE
jgi:hypothetical protein